MRVKQDMAALSIGMVATRSFMGLESRVINDRAVQAFEVFIVRPVVLAVITNPANVTNGAIEVMELA